METKHSDLLGPAGRDDADVRGEHSYPDRQKRLRRIVDDRPGAPGERPSYLAGGDGTDIVTPGAEGGSECKEDDHSA